MKLPTLFIFAIIFVFSSSFVSADRFGDGKGKFMSFFDSNNDDIVTMEELNAAAAGRFQKMDGDGSNIVTRDEFKSYIKERRQKRRANWFKSIDVNKDGNLSQQEYIDYKVKKAQSRFGNMDSNSDGLVSKDEFAHSKSRRWGKHRKFDGKKGKGKAARIFKKLDINGDGEVTKEESLQAWRGWFQRIDADRDQVVTSQEVKQYRQKKMTEK